MMCNIVLESCYDSCKGRQLSSLVHNFSWRPAVRALHADRARLKAQAPYLPISKRIGKFATPDGYAL